MPPTNFSLQGNCRYHIYNRIFVPDSRNDDVNIFVSPVGSRLTEGAVNWQRRQQNKLKNTRTKNYKRSINKTRHFTLTRPESAVSSILYSTITLTFDLLTP